MAVSTASRKMGGMKPSSEFRLTSVPHADAPVAQRSHNKGQKYPPIEHSPQDVQALLDACPDTPTGIRNRALVTLIYHSGIGVKEVLSLQASSIDFATHSVQLLQTKSGGPQIRNFRPSADDALKRWIQKREERGLQSAPLFCSVERHPGRPISPRFVRAIMADLADRAGVDRVSANSLRYSYAVRARREGADVAELQGQLGHKSIGHTARYVYGEPIARRQTYGAFQTEDQPNLLFRLYVPRNRLYATEADRLLSMFRDWLIATHGQGIRQSGYSTASGAMYEFVADSSIVQTGRREQFETFSNFLNLCTSNPSAAIDLLARNNVERSPGSDLVARFSKEVRRLRIDLRQEHDRRIMQLRHHLENELMNSREELSETPDILIDGLLEKLVPAPPAPESLALLDGPSDVLLQDRSVTVNVNQQIIHGYASTIIQSVQGEVNLSPQAKEMLALIDEYGGEETAVLKSAVHEFEDRDARPAHRSDAKNRLKRFLRQVGATAHVVGVDLLSKYVEAQASKIGI